MRKQIIYDSYTTFSQNPQLSKNENRKIALEFQISIEVNQ